MLRVAEKFEYPNCHASSDDLIKCMVENRAVQRWGDTVLRYELIRRADREWALAALPGSDRLQQFRQSYPGLEDQILHHYIASYLGMTAVTLSRLRSQPSAEEVPNTKHPG